MLDDNDSWFTESRIGFLLFGALGVLFLLLFWQPCLSEVPHCISPETFVTFADVVVMASLTFLLFLTYRNQTGILADQRDIAQAELRPKLKAVADFKLRNHEPVLDADETGDTPSDWFGVTVENRGNEMAEYARLIVLVDIGDTDESLRVPNGNGTPEVVEYVSSIQDLNDGQADVQTNRERPATVFTNSGKVDLQTTLSLAKDIDGELLKSPFIESLRKILLEADVSQSVTFGFILAYQDSNGRWLNDPLRPAYKITPDDAEDIEESFSLESVVREATTFPMEDLYPQLEDLQPLNEYYARFRSNREQTPE
jgi:hypothetical protein